jgi:hypothetical protein
MFRITVTNECPSPRFVADLADTFREYRTRGAAQLAVDKWNAHIAEYNRVMRQNVRYAVSEVYSGVRCTTGFVFVKGKKAATYGND